MVSQKRRSRSRGSLHEAARNAWVMQPGGRPMLRRCRRTVCSRVIGRLQPSRTGAVPVGGGRPERGGATNRQAGDAVLNAAAACLIAR